MKSAIEIECVLHNSGLKNLFVFGAKENDEGVLFGIVEGEISAKYQKAGNNMETFEIWQNNFITKGPITYPNKKPFGFSYLVEDPGVRYHKDGSGTPPDSEMVEHKETFETLQACVAVMCAFHISSKVVQEFVEQDINSFVEEKIETDKSEAIGGLEN